MVHFVYEGGNHVIVNHNSKEFTFSLMERSERGVELVFVRQRYTSSEDDITNLYRSVNDIPDAVIDFLGNQGYSVFGVNPKYN